MNSLKIIYNDISNLRTCHAASSWSVTITDHTSSLIEKCNKIQYLILPLSTLQWLVLDGFMCKFPTLSFPGVTLSILSYIGLICGLMMDHFINMSKAH